MRGVAGFDVVQFCKHRYHCGTRHTCHCRDEQNVGVIQPHKLCQEAHNDWEYNQFNARMQIQSHVFEHIREWHGCKQGTRYQNGDWRAERAEIVEKLRKCAICRGEQRSLCGNDIGLQKEQQNTNGAWNGAVVDKNLLWRELDVIAFAAEDENAPRPNKNIEHNHVKRAHKAADAVSENRIENREADESRICKYERELKHLGSVKVAFFHRSANEERHCCHQNVHSKANEEHLPSGSQIFLRELDVVQRPDNHHRLPDGDNEARERLGCFVVNDFGLAANITANHQEKERENDGEQSRKEI